MKPILMAIALAAAGCSSTREIEVEMVSAQLIKIDTVYRENTDDQQMLTWRDQDNIEYKSFASIRDNYRVGTIMTLLKKR